MNPLANMKHAILIGITLLLGSPETGNAAERSQHQPRPSAQPDGLQSAVAGLDALHAGQHDQAISLFTRALAAGLSKQDRANAYYDRGLAYLAIGQNQKAAADFRSALAIKPDDAEARRYLQTALSANPPSVSIPIQRPQSGAEALRAMWGPLAMFPGQSWIQSSSKSAGLYMTYQWKTPGTVIAFSGMDRNGQGIGGQYQYDPQTRKIYGRTLYKGTITSTVVDATPDQIVEQSSDPQDQTRQRMFRTGPSEFSIRVEALKRNEWVATQTLTLWEATPEMISALGWSQRAPPPSFMQQLGTAMKSGAAQGLADGVHDATQARIRGVLAPKAYPNGQIGSTVTIKSGQ